MESDPGAWTELAAAVVVASVAFAGLIFVAMSINIDTILSLPSVPNLALQGVILMTALAVAGMLVLVPSASITPLAIELIALGAFVLWAIASLAVRAYRQAPPEQKRNRISSGLMNSLPGILMSVAGISLLVGSGGGLYWLVPAWVIGIVAGVFNAWVMLVEIKR